MKFIVPVRFSGRGVDNWFIKTIKNNFLIISARSRCSWGSHCIVHRPFAQSDDNDTQDDIARCYLSVGRGTFISRHTKERTGFHLRHERFEIFKFWLWFVAENFDTIKGESRYFRLLIYYKWLYGVWMNENHFIRN